MPLLLMPPSQDCGPWQRTQYVLYDGKPPSGKPSVLIEAQQLSMMRRIGSVITTAGGEWPRGPKRTDATLSYDFAPGVPPLVVRELPYDGVGTGHQVWTAAVACCLFLRSDAGCGLLGNKPRVIEIGAGLGVPGLDIARRGVAQRVTATDYQPQLVEELARAAIAHGVGGEMQCRVLDWNSSGDIAAAATEAYDVCIGTDICYHEEDAAPLARTLHALGSNLTLLLAPLLRASVDTVCAELTGLGARVTETHLTLASTNAEGAVGGGAPGLWQVTPFRVLAVRWQDTSAPP